MNDMTSKAKPFSPSGKRQSLAVVSEKMISACVSVLNRACSPSAIAWLVALGVVYTVDTEFAKWSRPHVFDERLERVAPSFADGNSFGSIGFETVGVFGVASRFHRGPNLMLWHRRQTMGSVTLGTHFSGKASTALVVSTVEITGHDYSSFSAITEAFPKEFFVFVAPRESNYGQSAELDPGEVFASLCKSDVLHRGSIDGPSIRVNECLN